VIEISGRGFLKSQRVFDPAMETVGARKTVLQGGFLLLLFFARQRKVKRKDVSEF